MTTVLDCFSIKFKIIFSNQCSYKRSWFQIINNCHFLYQTQFRYHTQTSDFHSSVLSSTYSRGHRQWTRRNYSLFFVLTFTTLTKPSSQGYASITWPRGHSPLLAFGSTIDTTSPSFKLCLAWNHFFLTLRRGRNSCLHRFQNCPRSCCTRCHRFLGL